jgi:hypothetical protein
VAIGERWVVCYILRNDVVTARWELTMYDRTGSIG